MTRLSSLYFLLLVLLIVTGVILMARRADAGSPSIVPEARLYESRGDQGSSYRPSGLGTPTPCAGWSVVSSPNVGLHDNRLNAAAVNSLGGWAVGYYLDDNGHSRTLVEHWNGTSWSVVPSPNPGVNANVLNAVDGFFENNIWAVGRYANTNIQNTLILHWDGSTWSIVPSPNGPGNNVLMALSFVGDDDIWAVGQACNLPACTARTTLTEHWDGTSWSIVPSPNAGSFSNGLEGVTSHKSSNDIMAVGQTCLDADCSTSQPLAMNWDGSAWTILPTPRSGAYSTLHAVSVFGTHDGIALPAWAVGQTCTDSSCTSSQSLIEYWNEQEWVIVPSPNPGAVDTHLNAVNGGNFNNAWAAGSYSNDGVTYFNTVFHWLGTSWDAVQAPSPGSVRNDLSALSSFFSVQNLWAVGHMDDGTGERTLVEHYFDPGTCPRTATPTPTITPTRTATSTAIDTATQTAEPTSSTTSTATSITTASTTITPGSTLTATATRTATVTSTLTAEATETPAATATATPCSISFSDVRAGDWFYEYVRCLYCRGAISGYSDGTFRPYNTTTRGQVTKIIVLAFALPIVTPTGGPTFSDVSPGSAFYAYIETAAANRIVSGYTDGTFRPNNNVTRGQLSKIVVTAAGQVLGWAVINPQSATFSDVPPGSTFYGYVETAYCHTVIAGYSDGTFRPGNNATRAQISKIVCTAVLNPAVACEPATPLTGHAPVVAVFR